MSVERIRHARRLSRDFSKPIRIETPVHQTSYELDGQKHHIDIWHRHQYEFPVPKLGNEWLICEATPEESDELLEGWLQGITLSIRDYRRSPIAKKYGITKPINEHEERLVAYNELIEEYSSLRDGYLEKNIENGDPEDMERAETAQQVHDLILNKFVNEHYGLVGEGERPPVTVQHITNGVGDPSFIFACNSLLTAASSYMERLDYIDLFGNTQPQQNVNK